ncbi:HAD family hydrolase [Absicoccus intestinalis]|uniref:HAD family hydrolase n=1 Tax=Absicoccus intestinalis TaxID=2926319 RepID=A0ABU4WIH5_9FIRM|nr:HAD family hydrolase [Absicoccus sp. CLA-KB-P134]MDX8416356.1 HAD family hydrolase [Absicoccus sp. CLA-KB-P134]
MHFNDLKLIIFDVDGTLLDSERIWKETLGIVGRTYHMPYLEEQLFARLVGVSGQEEERIYKEVLDPSIRDVFVSEWRQLANRTIDETVPVKVGSHDFFQWVKKQGLQLGVATSTHRQETEYRLKKANLWEPIDYVLCGNEIEHKKPHPEIYQKMLEHFHLEPDQALVIEDSSIGVEAAYRANIPVIHVADLIEPTTQDKERAWMTCKNLKEALVYLDTD